MKEYPELLLAQAPSKILAKAPKVHNQKAQAKLRVSLDRSSCIFFTESNNTQKSCQVVILKG